MEFLLPEGGSLSREVALRVMSSSSRSPCTRGRADERPLVHRLMEESRENLLKRKSPELVVMQGRTPDMGGARERRSP